MCTCRSKKAHRHSYSLRLPRQLSEAVRSRALLNALISTLLTCSARRKRSCVFAPAPNGIGTNTFSREPQALKASV